MEDVLIVGGGIAGLQAAIQLGRGGHRVLVADSGRGRSTLCRSYHNVLGWPEGISGPELRRLGVRHAEQFGVHFVEDNIIKAEKKGQASFRLTGTSGGSYEARLLLIATGVMDRFPPWPELARCLGKTVYICPDCDSYEVRDRVTAVIGSGEAGARMALTLHGIAKSLVYLNHERLPVSDEITQRLNEAGIEIVMEPVRRIRQENDGCIRGVVLENGREYPAERGFIAFGRNEVRTGLLQQLGAERMEDGHVVSDPRTKQSSVPGVWAAGDIGVHSEQVVVAMGDGMQAAIWMHKELLKLEKLQKQAAPARP